MSEWKRVEDGMPPLGQWVQIFTGNAKGKHARRQYVAKRKQYSGRTRGWTTDDDEDWGIANRDVSHWALLDADPPGHAAIKPPMDAPIAEGERNGR